MIVIRIIDEHQKAEGANMSISCCVLQTKIFGHSDEDFGEFSNVTVWDTEEQALAEARQFLSQFTEVNEDDNLSDLQEFFRENRIADFCISFHRLPVGGEQ